MSKVETMEHWRFVPGWVGWYSVSSRGRVRRERGQSEGKILRPGVGSTGYLVVAFAKNGGRLKTQRVHRLVARAFIGECPEGLVVNHKDGVKTNNRVENLEYVTYGDNARHAYATGLRVATPRLGEKHPGAKLTDALVRELRADTTSSYDELCERYGMSRHALHAAKSGKTWGHVV